MEILSPVDEGVAACLNVLGKASGIGVVVEVRHIAWALYDWNVVWLQFLLQ